MLIPVFGIGSSIGNVVLMYVAKRSAKSAHCSLSLVSHSRWIGMMSSDESDISSPRFLEIRSASHLRWGAVGGVIGPDGLRRTYTYIAYMLLFTSFDVIYLLRSSRARVFLLTMRSNGVSDNCMQCSDKKTAWPSVSIRSWWLSSGHKWGGPPSG